MLVLQIQDIIFSSRIWILGIDPMAEVASFAGSQPDFQSSYSSKTVRLQEGTYDIFDAESFGKACADLWNRLREDKLAKATFV
jgi:hypothetical protein